MEIATDRQSIYTCDLGEADTVLDLQAQLDDVFEDEEEVQEAEGAVRALSPGQRLVIRFHAELPYTGALRYNFGTYGSWSEAYEGLWRFLSERVQIVSSVGLVNVIFEGVIEM